MRHHTVSPQEIFYLGHHFNKEVIVCTALPTKAQIPDASLDAVGGDRFISWP